MLIGCCEALISNGHNSEFRDPYTYPIPKLLYLQKVNTERLHISKVTTAMLDHSSRIATVTGEAELFNELINNLTEG